ncbi:BMA-MICU-1 [Dirofilaria immitis]|nr:BMA-MICU-1 [Dirofilaria immitis]
MLRTSCRRSLLRSPSVSVSVAKLESGIPSMNDIKKSDDYHSSKYTILGSKRKDPMLYTDRKSTGASFLFLLISFSDFAPAFRVSDVNNDEKPDTNLWVNPVFRS